MSANPFDTLSAGYAQFRPPVHPRIIERLRKHLPPRVERALDVGCGAGLSTKALEGIAGQCIGIDPAESMVHLAAATAPSAYFLAGRAEAVPLRDHSVDAITAAGSLNYADVYRFFEEAARVLTARGVVAVYDFSAGRSYRDSALLDRWFSAFIERYPWPPGEAQELNPKILSRAHPGFRVTAAAELEIAIPLTRAFYLEYMLTETNVAFAVRKGISLTEIRQWCEESLPSAWPESSAEVLFRGYFACCSVVKEYNRQIP